MITSAFVEFFVREWQGILFFLTGSLGVWLTIKENVLCWPISLIAVVISIIQFFFSRLYGDMALQIVYFFAGIYGWMYWEKNKNGSFEVKHMNPKLLPLLIIITGAQAFLYYFLLVHFKSDKPLMDAVLTACSLTVTYLMTKKWVENWLFWVVIDAAYIILYGLKELWFYAALSIIMTILAYIGWLKWKKEASLK